MNHGPEAKFRILDFDVTVPQGSGLVHYLIVWEVISPNYLKAPIIKVIPRQDSENGKCSSTRTGVLVVAVLRLQRNERKETK
jgi:hypothetical protein